MKASGFLCRSQASTAVCVPGDPRLMILPRGYSRLVDSRRLSSGSRGRAVTLPMVTKKQRSDSRLRPTATAVAAAATTNGQVFQVVVMRVSIHCQGCAGKVRKHLSKMEGVTSFSIDLESKRVTVMGHVSPVGVLESISKVKKAEFWPCS
ncbi:protein SODIUM POTASSIUM ROOT DEFECTIVE 1-like [Zingiber officinale]|uniref:HMA domain-containing protein n=1 Tax=Zingiber officinale TaxID=94328 RepID=A0A8J5EUI9_ZINOF|nr:protein SODIUM POTASSIUM ROOT DEFECTIVE 1-like [Zingiber officinale]KAG6470594.1 hypothetical protein ZIOFF_071668 [Zingiber officinale]